MRIPFHTQDGTVDLWMPAAHSMTAKSIGSTLAKINRYNGRTFWPWSVASHSLLVERICPHADLKAWALLHDAHEAFLGDFTTPAQELLCVFGHRPAVEGALHSAKGRLDRQIGAAWECAPRSMSLEIRRADWVALQAEMATFFNAPISDFPVGDREEILRACDVIPEIPSTNWTHARDGWVGRAMELASMGLLSLPRETTPSDMVSDV